jgi:hypothetical protein
MAAAVWTACTKLLFAEKSLAPEKAGSSPGPCCFMGVFEGVWEKVGVFSVVFCGGVVVNCMVERGELHGCFGALKTCH